MNALLRSDADRRCNLVYLFKLDARDFVFVRLRELTAVIPLSTWRMSKVRVSNCPKTAESLNGFDLQASF
jgi:hypothetical protein